MILAATALSSGDYAAIAGLLATFVGPPFMLGLFLLRSLGRRIDTIEQRAHERIDGVEQRVEKLGTDKVDKLDWLRVAGSSRKKLDHLGEQFAALNQRLDDEFGVGAAINNLASQVGRMVERKNDG